MINFRQKTIAKYVEWLKIAKEHVGQNFNLDDTSRQLKITRDIKYYAKKFNLLDIGRNHFIIRAKYNPEPIEARHFMEKMYAAKFPSLYSQKPKVEDVVVDGNHMKAVKVNFPQTSEGKVEEFTGMSVVPVKKKKHSKKSRKEESERYVIKITQITIKKL